MTSFVPAAALLAALAAAPGAALGADGRLPGYFVPKDKATAARLLLRQEAATFLGRTDARFWRAHPACRSQHGVGSRRCKRQQRSLPCAGPTFSSSSPQ